LPLAAPTTPSIKEVPGGSLLMVFLADSTKGSISFFTSERQSWKL
jgi:hypothetical protein